MIIKRVNAAIFKLRFGAPSNPINVVNEFESEDDIDFKLNEDGERLTLLSKDKKMISIEKYVQKDGKACLMCYSEQAHFFGFGEKMGELDKRGRKMEMLNSDNPLHLPDTDPLYISIPFFIVLSPYKPTIGLFLNSTSKTYFSMNGDEYAICSEDDGLELYIIYGPKVSDVLKRFSLLVGRMELPPAWALGYQQSRWSYFTSEEVLNVAEKMRRDKIPCDVIYLDIDYMQNYKVFTWSKESFPDPKRMVDRLKEMGFKIVTIVDPGVKIENGYDVYESGKEKDVFVKKKGGEIFEGYVWPGKCHFPDFLKENTREWWAQQHDKLFKMGVNGIWNDMNEPSIIWDDEKSNEVKSLVENRKFVLSTLERLKGLANQKNYVHDIIHEDDTGKKWEHLKVRNVYALLESQATKRAFELYKKNQRPFILSRAGFAGIQRNAAVWTGDNSSWWEHLKNEMAMALGLSVSGVSFCGGDVGGFGSNATPELLVRWIEMGAFLPFFRNHSAIGTSHQEPWAFDEKTENIIRTHIQKRYELFPYFYTLFYESSVTGLPIIRPLFMQDEEDETLYSINDEFMLGNSMLIAPITQPNTYWRAIYFPKGRWIDVRNGEIYEGKRLYKVDAPLEEIPVFVKMNSMLLKTQALNYIFEKKRLPLYVEIYGDRANSILYEDDGETLEYKKGKYNLYRISAGSVAKSLHVNVEYLKHGYTGIYERIIFKFFAPKVSNVYVNREETPVFFKNGVPQVEFDISKVK